MLRLASILIAVSLLMISCRKNAQIENHSLVFSADTIYFDTVFTTIGSTTRELRVRNIEKQKLIIDEIYLSGGSESRFRLNIDGEPVDSKKNIEIEAGDSLFIFVDVNIDPTAENAPVAVTDSIIFITSGIGFKVQLLAWGQDIYLMKDKVIDTQTWDSLKPYVIYGNVLIDTAETLTIEKGSRVYFHWNSSMTVAGTIIVNGVLDSRVLFAGDRLEKMYEDIPGQWMGIQIMNISSGNNIDYADIRNSVNGIQVGRSETAGLSPDLELFSSQVLHSTVSCISGVNAKIRCANSIFSHAGKYCINLSSGGDYQFTHCTIFNIWDYGFRLTPSVYISEKPGSGSKASQVNLGLNNCAVYGDMTSELDIVPSGSDYTGTYLVDHCLLKLDTISASFWSVERFPGAVINKDPGFIDSFNYDFRPDTLSTLIDKGNPLYLADYPLDFRGESRNKDGKPDIGAYERITGEH